MAAFTHVLEYDGGIFTREIGPSTDINVFADTLRRFDGVAPWALSLWVLPDGKGHEKMLEMVSRPEVFDAADAAELFFVYYTTGDIPPESSLRPVEGWTAEGTSVDLRESVASRNSKPSSSP
jgi:hypothetical protein